MTIWKGKRMRVTFSLQKKSILKILAKFQNDKSLPVNCNGNISADLEFSKISYNFIIIIQLYNVCCYAN